MWDYDGTLVDSTKKNMAVTIDVLRHFFPDVDENLPDVLSSLTNYQTANYRYKNWRELYHECYRIPEDRIDEAGRLWTPCQLNNKMIPELFPGLEEVIPKLSQYRMGICSQNSSENIRNVLQHYRINECFPVVIGYDDIPLRKQKPEPDGFVSCINRLGIDMNNTTALYIGDHSEDVTFGKNAERLFREQGLDVSVICIAVGYSGMVSGGWNTQPDYVIHTPDELLRIIEKLG